jgi:uncharacterized membrane protein YheB (UPF0754 family)
MAVAETQHADEGQAMHHIMAVGGILDWEKVTGQSKFVVDIVSIPIFSAIAGVITNWTGVIMLFAPIRFRGFHCPGVKTLFPFLPRKLQILPIFAPGGILGFQGFIPARAEKMASICVDKGLAKLGSIRDFMNELDPAGIADQLTLIAGPELRRILDSIMERENPELWRDLPPAMKQVVYQRLEQKLPEITHHAMADVQQNIDDLIDVKLMCVGYLRENPVILKDIIYELGEKELKFMVRIGFTMGLPMGIVLALFLQVYDKIPVIGSIPAWLFVIGGASLIGIIVNIIAIKVVFEPGEPAPRYRYLWKQAKFAKRQNEAAASFGHALAYKVITVPNIARELLYGPRADKTRYVVEKTLLREIDSVLGPVRALVRVAVGGREYEAIRHSGTGAAMEVAPKLVEDLEFTQRQAVKIDTFCTTKLRELPPEEFMEMLYSAIEQDAWLLYAHGGFLGLFVGIIHLIIFGA